MPAPVRGDEGFVLRSDLFGTRRRTGPPRGIHPYSGESGVDGLSAAGNPRYTTGSAEKSAEKFPGTRSLRTAEASALKTRRRLGVPSENPASPHWTYRMEVSPTGQGPAQPVPNP